MPDNIVRVQDGFVYRSGSRREKDMTPRPDHDLSANLQEAGLSTWRALESAIKPGGKPQKIDLTKLDQALLGCYSGRERARFHCASRYKREHGYDKVSGMGGDQDKRRAAPVDDDGYGGGRRKKRSEVIMSENCYGEQQWHTLHEEIQERLHTLASEIQVVAANIQPHYGKTVTKRFPLFSHVSFSPTQRGDGNDIIVGVDIAMENGQWRLDADICDEEGGTIYFELPTTPFSAASFDEFKSHVLRTTEQLIKAGKPALRRLFDAPTPACEPPRVFAEGCSEVNHDA